MILLDTHVWLWLLHDPSQLSSQAQAAIDSEEPQSGLLVSAISAWEIAIKFSIGKLTLPLPVNEWYALAQTHSGIVIEHLNPRTGDRQYTATG
ncbi:MAG: type II toxin-antitoxin system VapC family toxin [Nostoc sp.]|uniref:type II toxin-antitoxin system VapC family toxin n=1 Tax=Nostoc sp. TaxID=1180 RepID=UPI002FF50FEE